MLLNTCNKTTTDPILYIETILKNIVRREVCCNRYSRLEMYVFFHLTPKLHNMFK